jgi:hypothetical protein
MTDETVIGLIPTARIKTGLFSSKAYTLVFTDRRLLLAEMTKQLVTAETERARAAAKEQGGGRLSQWSAQLKTSVAFGAQYLGADPAAILAETPGNVALNPGDVRSIRIERKTRNAGSEDLEQLHLRITIETAAGKQTYDTDGEKPELDEARAMAAPAFGPLLR